MRAESATPKAMKGKLDYSRNPQGLNQRTLKCKSYPQEKTGCLSLVFGSTQQTGQRAGYAKSMLQGATPAAGGGRFRGGLSACPSSAFRCLQLKATEDEHNENKEKSQTTKKKTHIIIRLKHGTRGQQKRQNKESKTKTKIGTIGIDT